MKRFFLVYGTILLAAGMNLFAAALATNTTPETPEILSVAVFDFESKDEAVRDLGPKVATLVNANLSADPNLVTVERAELEKVLGEHELNLSGAVSPDSAVKVGQLTGAKVLVTGRVFKADNQTFMVSKVIGTETSRVFGQIVQGKSSDNISDMAQSLAKKISDAIAQKGSTLTARVVPREERIAKIKQALAGKKLPVVSVKINEQHFGRPVIDPAAETEFFVVLKECGFGLVDSKSTNKATIEISGDAFSAYAMQKGNLVSCKARVEIKVRDTETGNLILADRQTSVGIDVAEQTAAKTGLEKAAFDLAERVLPKIVK